MAVIHNRNGGEENNKRVNKFGTKTLLGRSMRPANTKARVWWIMKMSVYIYNSE